MGLVPPQLSAHVWFDDYDGHGYLLDIKQGVLEELDEQSTRVLRAALRSASMEETIRPLSPSLGDQHLESEGENILRRLQNQNLLLSQRENTPSESLRGKCFIGERNFQPVPLKQRLEGAGHMLLVLHELRQERGGLFFAYQYLCRLKETMMILSREAALVCVQEEYWWYRLVTGLVERRIAHLLGQARDAEGLCMVRSFALCTYLLFLGAPAQVLIARPKFGTRSGFKLHVWTELYKKPINEVPNIRERYRVMCGFPTYP